MSSLLSDRIVKHAEGERRKLSAFQQQHYSKLLRQGIEAPEKIDVANMLQLLDDLQKDEKDFERDCEVYKDRLAWSEQAVALEQNKKAYQELFGDYIQLKEAKKQAEQEINEKIVQARHAHSEASSNVRLGEEARTMLVRTCLDAGLVARKADLEKQLESLRHRRIDADTRLRDARSTVASQMNELDRLQKIGSTHPENLTNVKKSIDRFKEAVTELETLALDLAEQVTALDAELAKVTDLMLVP